MSLSQIEIRQEAITLSVFVSFAVLCVGSPLKLDDVRAGLCLVGAVCFVFRS
jgi:uncharacterized protein